MFNSDINSNLGGIKYLGLLSATLVTWRLFTIDLSSYSNYKNLTMDDIILSLKYISRTTNDEISSNEEFSYSYDASTGKVSISKPDWGLYDLKFDVYVTK